MIRSHQTADYTLQRSRHALGRPCGAERSEHTERLPLRRDVALHPKSPGELSHGAWRYLCVLMLISI